MRWICTLAMLGFGLIAMTAAYASDTKSSGPALPQKIPRRSIVNGTLDPSQGQALLALGVLGGPDPCNTASQHAVICDEGVPYRRLVLLQLEYCSEGAIFPFSAWFNLSSLKSLSFYECPAELDLQVPSKLADSLTSLTCTASLGRSVDNVMAPGLPGIWLNKFHNLRELSVSDVVVNATSLASILSSMKQLQKITFSNSNLSGSLPHIWPATTITSIQLPGNDLSGPIATSIAQLSGLQSLDLSNNDLTGRICKELATLTNLQSLNLAGNRLSGSIPSFLQNLTSLMYLDLSDNQLNGSIPTFLSSMPGLRYIDLRKNHLQGEIPFSDSYMRALNSLKLSGNPSLCYNSTIISARFAEGVQPCDSTGLPVAGPGASPYNYAPTPSPQSDPFEHTLAQRRGPSKIAVVLALALACIAGAIVSTILLSKRCSSKG